MFFFSNDVIGTIIDQNYVQGIMWYENGIVGVSLNWMSEKLSMID